MYRAIVSISIDLADAEDLESARAEALEVVRALTVLPSACMLPQREEPIVILDQEGRQLYPTPPCVRCGDSMTEERYESNGICNYCNHMLYKEMRDEED